MERSQPHGARPKDLRSAPPRSLQSRPSIKTSPARRAQAANNQQLLWERVHGEKSLRTSLCCDQCVKAPHLYLRLLQKKVFDYTVGTVPPSMTISVPLIVAARSDARKAMSSATSSGRLGRPTGIPPKASINPWRAVS